MGFLQNLQSITMWHCNGFTKDLIVDVQGSSTIVLGLISLSICNELFNGSTADVIANVRSALQWLHGRCNCQCTISFAMVLWKVSLSMCDEALLWFYGRSNCRCAIKLFIGFTAALLLVR